MGAKVEKPWFPFGNENIVVWGQGNCIYPNCKLETQINEHVAKFLQDNNTCTFRKKKHGHVMNDKISTK
jgi:hypothetical protein